MSLQRQLRRRSEIRSIRRWSGRFAKRARALRKKGIPIGDHRARQLRKADYNRYDLLIGMDEENLSDMNCILGGDPEGKLHYLMEYTDRPEHKIEDPWYTRRFDACADEIIEGCEGLLAHSESKRR